MPRRRHPLRILAAVASLRNEQCVAAFNFNCASRRADHRPRAPSRGDHRNGNNSPILPPRGGPPPALFAKHGAEGGGGDVKSEGGPPSSTVASQAALIAGTTIGGGFLALPAATAPCGAAPAALGLFGVWLFLLGGALSLSDAIFMMKRRSDSSGADERDLSLFSLIRECFGSAAGLAGGLLFLLLIKVTLVAQLSKAGALLEGALPILDRRAWTPLFSVSIAALCLAASGRRIERINDALTAAMACSFAALVALAGGSGWSAAGLARADYASLLPPMAAASTGRPWAVPVFVQLLIYNEVVPLVASRLGDEGEVRRAIVMGSSVPLAMCLAWSCVAMGLVPYEPSAAAAAGAVYDPLSRLSEAVLAKGAHVGKAFLASVNALAGSAICTTVIGCVLASTQYFDDVMTNFLVGRGERAASSYARGNESERVTVGPSVRRRILTHALAIVPSAAVALCGSSDLYYRATSFAGEFPCTLLYGLVPPLCNLKLRWKLCRSMEGEERTSGWRDVILQTMLAGVSLSILSVSFFSR